MRLKIFSFKKKDKPLINRLFRQILIVMVLAAFVVSLSTAINSIFITRFFNGNSGAGMAAMSLAITSITIIDIFSSILTTGTQAKSAGAMAKVNKKLANEYVTAGIILGLVVGLALFLVGFFASPYIANGLAEGRSADITLLTTQYLKGFFIGIPFYILCSILRPVAILDGDRKLVFFSLIAILLVNIFGNLLNGYYIHGGVFGVALSTAIGYFISSIILIMHFFRKKSFLVFKIKYFNFSIAINLIRRGCVNLTKALATALFQLYTNFILLYAGGPIALTILGIQASCFSVVNSLVNGVYDCGFMLNHVFSAEEDDKAIYDLAGLLYRFVFLFVTTISIVFVIIAPTLATSYQISNPEAYNQLVLAIRCSIAVVPFVAIQTIAIVFMPVIYCHIAFALRVLVFPIIFSLIFMSFMGIDGFWVGNAVGNCFYIVFHIIFCRIKYKHWPHTMIETYFLPKDFGYDNNKILRYRVESRADFDFLYREVIVFCKTLKIDKARSNNLITATKALGEIYDLSNLYRREGHHAEILIYYKKGELGMRLRDNSDIDFKDDIRKDTINVDKLNKTIATMVVSFSDINYINVLNVSTVVGVI